MQKNTKVRLSKAAINAGMSSRRRGRAPRTEGIIIKPPAEQKIATVLWDGRKNPEDWHVDYLEQA